MDERASDEDALEKIILTDRLEECHRNGDQCLTRTGLARAGDELDVLVEQSIHKHALFRVERVDTDPFGDLNAHLRTEDQSIDLAITAVAGRLAKLAVTDENVFVDKQVAR